MKRNFIITALAVLVSVATFAQTSTQRIHIKGGNDAWENFMKEIYRYPSFEQGIVEYKNGQRFKSVMNYNKALGTIQFIDEKGDTLAMTNEESIGTINIGNDVFIYAPECLLALKNSGKSSLYKNEKVRIADKLKTGSYGIPNSTGTIESIDRIDTRLSYNQIDINESLLLSKVTTYFLENEKGEIFTASKKNVLGMYSKHDDAIKSFIKSYSLDFSREDHLLELTDFLSKL